MDLQAAYARLLVIAMTPLTVASSHLAVVTAPPLSGVAYKDRQVFVENALVAARMPGRFDEFARSQAQAHHEEDGQGYLQAHARVTVVVRIMSPEVVEQIDGNGLCCYRLRPDRT